MLLPILGYVGAALVFYGCICYFAKKDPHQDEGVAEARPESSPSADVAQADEVKQPERENELTLSR